MTRKSITFWSSSELNDLQDQVGALGILNSRLDDVVMDGKTDDSAAVTAKANAQATQGGGPVVCPAGRTIAVHGLPLLNDVPYSGGAGSTWKYNGANSGSMFVQSTSATPILRSGVKGFFGRMNIDGGAATGVKVFDLHSPNANNYEHLNITVGDQTGTVFYVRCDVTTVGSTDNKNAAHNVFNDIICGSHGTFLDAQGNSDAAGAVVTLNHFSRINARGSGVVFLGVGPYMDSNDFIGVRTSLNLSNGKGVVLADDAHVYWNTFLVFVDTFSGGQTGRQALVEGTASSRNVFYFFGQNPAAETPISGQNTSNVIAYGDWVEAGSPSSGLSSMMRGMSQVTSRQTLTYSASMTPDMTLMNQKGTFRVALTNSTAMAVNNPTGATTGQRVKFEFLQTFNGAAGVITWGSAYKVMGGATGFTGPSVQNKLRSIEFEYDGTNYWECERTTADVG